MTKSPPVRALLAYLLRVGNAERPRHWLARLPEPMRAYLRRIGEGDVLTVRAVRAFGDELFESYCRHAGVLVCDQTDYSPVRSALAELRLPSQFTLALKQYWRFVLYPKAVIAERRAGKPIPVKDYRQIVRVIGAFLADIAREHVTLQTLHQGHIDQWAVRKPEARRSAVRHFVLWLRRARYIQRPLQVPLAKHKPFETLSAAEFVGTIRRALVDEALPLWVRVTVLLIVFCNLPQRELVHTQCRQFRIVPDAVTFRANSGAVVHLQGKVAALLRRFLQKRRGWLFPSWRIPGRPIHTTTIGDALRDSGFPTSRTLRRTMLWDAVMHCGASDVARMFGYAPQFVGERSQNYAGDEPAVRRYLAATGPVKPPQNASR